MLVLSRKVGQSIKIGDTVVHVLRVAGAVRIGVEAPAQTKILRGELQDPGPEPDGKGPYALPKAA